MLCDASGVLCIPGIDLIGCFGRPRPDCVCAGKAFEGRILCMFGPVRAARIFVAGCICQRQEAQLGDLLGTDLFWFFASMAVVVVCGQAGRMDAERSQTRWAFLFAKYIAGFFSHHRWCRSSQTFLAV